MSFESISTEAMNNVVGGMSGGELACRTAGGIVGGAAGALVGASPLGPVMAIPGALNTLTTASKGDPTFALDAVAAGASIVPGASVPAGAWTGARIGSRAGAALCGYRP